MIILRMRQEEVIGVQNVTRTNGKLSLTILRNFNILEYPDCWSLIYPTGERFRNSERQFQKLSVIENPIKYTDMIKVATIVSLGNDCVVYD